MPKKRQPLRYQLKSIQGITANAQQPKDKKGETNAQEADKQ